MPILLRGGQSKRPSSISTVRPFKRILLDETLKFFGTDSRPTCALGAECVARRFRVEHREELVLICILRRRFKRILTCPRP